MEFFDVLLPDVPLTDVLQRIATLSTRAAPRNTMAAITLPGRGGVETPVYTDQRALAIDEVQYEHDAGPCLEALRTGEVVEVSETASDARWRPFCETALANGVRSSLSVPLDVAGNREDVIGALNLYSEMPDGFDDSAIRATESFAHQAAILVANAKAYWGAVQLSQQLQQAIASRATIEQAKGILMARGRVGPEAAFESLVRASQRENRKLREIASEVVQRAAKRRGDSRS